MVSAGSGREITGKGLVSGNQPHCESTGKGSSGLVATLLQGDEAPRHIIWEGGRVGELRRTVTPFLRVSGFESHPSHQRDVVYA